MESISTIVLQGQMWRGRDKGGKDKRDCSYKKAKENGGQ